MIPSIANIRKAIYCLNKRIDQLEGGNYQDTMVELSNKISALESLLDDDAQNPTKAIDKFNEIVAFLNSIDNTETLQELLRDVIQQSYQQNYVTVLTYANLPTPGSADTIYRVSNYNGSTNQIDTTSYSEYVWDNSDYTLLCVKSQMSEIFDVSAYHATGGTLATYSDLSAALDSNNGGGVPQSFQKGGMRIQFVRTSDNKYVQYRYMETDAVTVATFTNVANWQGVDDEPTFESDNLVKSGGVYYAIESKSKTSLVDKDGFHVVDENLNVGMRYDEDGLDAAKVSSHFVEVLKASGISADDVMSSCASLVNENGFFIVDEELNIGVKVDSDGIHAKNILEYEIVED